MSERKCWCFYHGSDLDGHCAGAVVRRWCRLNGYGFVPRPVDYGRPVDWFEGAGADNLAVIVDFTPEGDDPAGVMRRMAGGRAGGLVWIDHHETAIGRAGAAACRLAWEYFFPGEPEPRAVELLGLYDVFDRSDIRRWENAILPFNFGLRLFRTDPRLDEPVWREVFDETGFAYQYGEIQSLGEAHLVVLERQNEALCETAAFDCVFQGRPACAVNARGNSLVLDACARPEHELRILFSFTGGRWIVRLFENGHRGVHCGKLAERFGGGGHAGAAGFELPPERSPLEVFDRIGGLNPDTEGAA